MVDVIDSDSIEDLGEKLNAKQIGVKVYRTVLRRKLQTWGNDDILIFYAMTVGHLMVCKAQDMKPVRHIFVGAGEAFRECQRRMLPKK
jgi:hypothetical protein